MKKVAPPQTLSLPLFLSLIISYYSNMSGEKRPAQEAFGTSSQLVAKRKKSDDNLNSGNAVVKSKSQNGTLVQAVCTVS